MGVKDVLHFNHKIKRKWYQILFTPISFFNFYKLLTKTKQFNGILHDNPIYDKVIIILL